MKAEFIYIQHRNDSLQHLPNLPKAQEVQND